MVSAEKIIKRVTLTEKATLLSSELNQYVFEVFKGYNKMQIAKAVEDTFNVSVASVNVLNKRGKKKRSRTQRGKSGVTASSKRAIVKLRDGDKIDLM